MTTIYFLHNFKLIFNLIVTINDHTNTHMDRILIIDDDEDILETITLVLELGGYQVKGLLNAESVEDEIISFKPHLIVLDIVIGDLDGRNICRTLKQQARFQKTPILMMSAMFKTQDVMGKDYGPDDFLPKPFDITELVDRISNLIAQKKILDYNIN